MNIPKTLNTKGDITRALRQKENFKLDEKLIDIDLSCANIGYYGAEALAKVLEDNTTLQSLVIDREIGCDGALKLIEALKENTTLTQLTILDDGERLNNNLAMRWERAEERIKDLLEKNKRALCRKSKEEEKIKKELAKKQREDEELKKKSALQAKKNQEAEEVKQRASLKAWIESNNWEAVAAFIKEHSDFAITNFLSSGKYNLNTVTFINQLSAHTVQRTIDELEVAQTSLSKKNGELTTQSQSLKKEEQELKKRLVQVGAKIKQVAEESQAVKNDLNAKTEHVTKAKENLKVIEDSLADKMPKLKQWKERLQTDILKWTDHDVEFLLQELDMSNHSSKFLKNKIDGSVLLDLTTSDLIDTLNVTFKEAKRLLKSVFLAQMYKDIYTTPPGVLQWHVDTVCSWLEDNKFAHLTDIFRKQQITGSELAFIDRNDLKKYLKIEALGDCIKLEKVIKQLQQSHLADRSIQKQIAVELDEEKIAGQMSELEHKLHEMKNINEELKLKLKNAKKDAPEVFSCPITQEIMNDPVVASDGHTYERVAIEAWLLHHDTSPMTNQRLENKSLTPSHTLKSMIREFVDRK